MKKNVNVIVTKTITMSPAAYVEFDKLRKAVENGSVNSRYFDNWKYNPYFLTSLYEYYKENEKKALAFKVKSVIKNLDWFFDGKKLYVYNDGHCEVVVRKYGKYEEDGFSDKIYTGDSGFKIIRDECIPVVLNY